MIPTVDLAQLTPSMLMLAAVLFVACGLAIRMFGERVIAPAFGVLLLTGAGVSTYLGYRGFGLNGYGWAIGCVVLAAAAFAYAWRHRNDDYAPGQIIE